MAVKPLPDQQTLRQLLDYDPEAGFLFWRIRDPSFFTDGYRDAVGCARNWNSRFAGQRALTARHSNGYRHGIILGQDYLAHRVVWKWWHGSDPVIVDHLNGVKDDNRVANLSSGTSADNAKNTPLQCNNTSGVVGVHLCNFTGRWRAEIWANGKNNRIGRFDNFEDAVAARRAAERKFGFHENHGRHT